jgi:hypothetical protein
MPLVFGRVLNKNFLEIQGTTIVINGRHIPISVLLTVKCRTMFNFVFWKHMAIDSSFLFLKRYRNVDTISFSELVAAENPNEPLGQQPWYWCCPFQSSTQWGAIPWIADPHFWPMLEPNVATRPLSCLWSRAITV